MICRAALIVIGATFATPSPLQAWEIQTDRAQDGTAFSLVSERVHSDNQEAVITFLCSARPRVFSIMLSQSGDVAHGLVMAVAKWKDQFVVRILGSRSNPSPLPTEVFDQNREDGVRAVISSSSASPSVKNIIKNLSTDGLMLDLTINGQSWRPSGSPSTFARFERSCSP